MKTVEQVKEEQPSTYLTELDPAEYDEPEEVKPLPCVLDFNDEMGETLKANKLKKFEEFKQRREKQE